MRIGLPLALLTGLLLVLLYPPFGYAALAPLAVAPLCVALGREYRPAMRFLLGFASGLVLWAGVCWWIAPVLAVHGAMGTAGGWGTFALFCVLKSIHYGLFGLLTGVLIRRWYGAPAIGLLWAVLERSQEPLTLFGWLMLGDAGIGMSLPLRVAPFAGVYGLSFLFALTGACFAVVLLRQERRRALWALLILTPVVLPPVPKGMRPTAHAAVVQPNLDAATEWTPERYAGAKVLLSTESVRALSKGHVDIVAWPETPGPMWLASDRDLQVRVAEVAEAAKAPVLLGALARGADGALLNSAYLVDARTAVRYDKVFLVPFGEYVPAPFGFVNQVSDEAGAYTPGKGVVTLPLNGRRAGVFICYESAVGHHVREFARAGAEVFFNLSNDGYFFRTPAREQHLQLVRMRAVENRRWVVRATNNGITASIDPAGTVREELGSFSVQTGRLGFDYQSHLTWFTLYGDWFIWLGAAVVVASLVASQWPNYLRTGVARK